MPSKGRGSGRRGHGRGRVAVVENSMDPHETSRSSSPSSCSERDGDVKLAPRSAPLVMSPYSGLADSGPSLLLNPKINHRSDAIFGDQAVEQLKLRHHKPLKFHERYLPYLRDAGLLGLSQICQKMPQLDKALITALVERWRPETHSFHMASGEMTVTLQDVAMLLGLPIDGRPVCSTTDHDYGQMVVDYLGHDPRGPSMPGKSFLHYKWLKKHFYELPDGADDQTLERHVRAYILSLLCGVLFPDGTGRMSLIYLPLIADLSRVGMYSWGSAVLAFLYRSLCTVASSHNIKNIGGSLLLLQLWSWERSHVGRPLVRSQPCTETGNPPDLPPAGFRWVGARTQSENATRCLKQYRDELNLQRADQVKWEPYVHIGATNLPPLCTKDADLWLTQAPLINFPIVEMYLPERVMRQFGLRQCIPPPFRPTLQALHRISRRGRERENWEETHHEYIQEWEARRQRVFRETEQYDLSSYEEYLQWYSGATRRYLVPSADGEEGPSSPPQDSSELQYQAKSPMIRKAVEKLHGMMKKAKRTLTSTSDATTQALVVEFLHGFQDVLHDLGEVKEKCDSAAAPTGLAVTPYVDSTTLPVDSLPSHQVEQDILVANQEVQEDIHMMELDTVMLEPTDVENNNADNHVLPPCPSALALDEKSDSAIAAKEKCQSDIPATGSATAEHSVDINQEAERREKPHLMEHDRAMVEPTIEEANGDSCRALSPCPSLSALEPLEHSTAVVEPTIQETKSDSDHVLSPCRSSSALEPTEHSTGVIEPTTKETNSDTTHVLSPCRLSSAAEPVEHDAVVIKPTTDETKSDTNRVLTPCPSSSGTEPTEQNAVVVIEHKIEETD